MDMPCPICQNARVPETCVELHRREQFHALVRALTGAFAPADHDPTTVRAYAEDAEAIIEDMITGLRLWTELDDDETWELWDPEWAIEKRGETPRGGWFRFAVNGAEYAAPLSAEGFNAAEPWTTEMAVTEAFDY